MESSSPAREEINELVFCLAGGYKNMLIRSLIKRYRYIKALDKLTFSESIPIKIVLKRKSPAGHRNDVIKKQGKKVTKEWYEVAILTEVGNEFNIAVHEVRHRVQLHNPEMPLFTKDKLIKMQKKHPQEAIQQIIDHLEVIEKKYQELLPEIEQDAIIVAKLIEQKCQGLPDPLKTASEWIKKTP